MTGQAWSELEGTCGHIRLYYSDGIEVVGTEWPCAVCGTDVSLVAATREADE